MQCYKIIGVLKGERNCSANRKKYWWVRLKGRLCSVADDFEWPGAQRHLHAVQRHENKIPAIAKKKNL